MFEMLGGKPESASWHSCNESWDCSELSQSLGFCKQADSPVLGLVPQCCRERTKTVREHICAPKEVIFEGGAMRTMEQGQARQGLEELSAGTLARGSGLTRGQ